MTATSRTNPTLAEVVAVHEAASALGQPSRVYRAGAILGVDRWTDHAITLENAQSYGPAEDCFKQAVLADVYGTSGRIAETFERGRRR